MTEQQGLPRVVCVCGAVSVGGECHGVPKDVSYEVFFALCLSAVRLLEETAFGGHASIQSADPSIADFLEHLTAACPRPVIHAGQKCRQFCGIAWSWPLNELCLELVPHEDKI